jgi:hypothetical protein
MTDDVFNKADSLMQRHRRLLDRAVPVSAAVEPSLRQTDGEDLPVLTDVVAARPSTVEHPIPRPPESVEALARDLLFQQLPAQREALALELASWLDDELPQIVMRILDGMTDQIVTQVTQEARASLLPRLQSVLEGETFPSGILGGRSAPL